VWDIEAMKAEHELLGCWIRNFSKAGTGLASQEQILIMLSNDNSTWNEALHRILLILWR
jgi:hypothetical protein